MGHLRAGVVVNDQEWKAVAWLFWLFVFVALGLVVFAAYMGLGR